MDYVMNHGMLFVVLTNNHKSTIGIFHDEERTHTNITPLWQK